MGIFIIMLLWALTIFLTWSFCQFQVIDLECERDTNKSNAEYYKEMYEIESKYCESLQNTYYKTYDAYMELREKLPKEAGE